MNHTPYFSDESVTLYLGSCEEILPSIASVQHVITDPPYSAHVHGNARRNASSMDPSRQRYGKNTPRNVDLGFTHLTPELRAFCAEQFARVAERWVLVFSDVESDHLWRDDLTAHGLDYVRTGAWHKVGSTPQFSGDRPATAFEAITICHPAGKKRWNGGGSHAWWSVPIVLDRSRKGGERLHPTQKPLPLMEALVDQFTDEGETILDPFGGSGTTAIAAAEMGRKCIVVERDEKHAETIAQRVQTRRTSLFGGVA